MPLQETPLHAGIVYHRSNQFRNAAGQSRTWISDSEAEGVTETDLDVNTALLPEFHQFNTKGHAEAVNVGTSYIFEMTAGRNASFQCSSDDAQVLLHDLGPGAVQLIENMVVGDRGKNTGLLQAHLNNQCQIFLNRANPSGDLRIPVTFG